MNSIFRNGINYIGITDSNFVKNSSMKLFNISDIIKLDNGTDNKISNIIQVKCDIEILKEKIVNTPKGISLEGSILTGTKVFFNGYVHCNIQYSKDESNTSIYKLNKKISFLESLNLPLENRYKNKVINVIPYIVDISCVKIDQATIFITIIIQTNLDY